jgi:protein phosphatase PTC7
MAAQRQQQAAAAAGDSGLGGAGEPPSTNGLGSKIAAAAAAAAVAAAAEAPVANGAPSASAMREGSDSLSSSTTSSSGGGTAAASDSSSDASSSSRDLDLPTSTSAAAAAAATSATATPPPSPRGPAPAPAVVMLSGASMLPHPEKAHRGGEDAFFISEPPLAIGVADGVGGWAEIGVDAGAYARLLMLHAKEEAEALLAGGAPGAALSPQAVLEGAYRRTNVQGSSTVCILALNGATLCASNLGDSGFVIVRDGGPAFQSPQQQHNFNFPYQLGSADGGASDHPQSAMRFELTVQDGDIVISGSDGLWDNVFAEEAATIVSRCRAQGDGPEAAAHTLCRCGSAADGDGRCRTAAAPTLLQHLLHPSPRLQTRPDRRSPHNAFINSPPQNRYARMRAVDPKYHSPFSYSAIQAGYVFLGGKLDDITVLVSYIESA